MKIEDMRKKILNEIKPNIISEGWNDNLIINFSKLSKNSLDELQVLFPDGYEELLQLYLDQINENMTDKSKKLDLLRLKVHERIREIIKLRLKIMLKEKKIISKTFLYLLIPTNYKLASKNLYRTIDQIWFLAGDNSTDFNFYSKRIILASIYTNTILHFINNDKIDKTYNFLDSQLKRVSKIPKIKKGIKNIISVVPKIFKLKNNLSIFKQ